MGDLVEPVTALLLGVIIQELLWWYNIRRKLSIKKYKNLIRSWGYWIMSFSLAAFTVIGIMAWKWNSIGSYSTLDLMLFSAAIPVFIKEAVGIIGKKDRNLGVYSNSSLSSYFLMGIRDE